MKIKRRPIFLSLVLLNLVLIATVAWLWLRRSDSTRVGETGFPRVVARVNGQPILAEELLSAAHIAGGPPTTERCREVLRQLIATTVIRQQSGKIAAPVELRTLHYQFHGEEEYRKARNLAGLSENQVRDRLERTLGAVAWLQQRAAITPTEARERQYFEQNQAAFTFPEVVEARHFVSIFPPDQHPAGMLETVDRFNQARQRLKDGLPFPQLIDALSDDPAKKVTHGSLSWFARDRMEPPLIDTAFVLPVGQISAPVQTRFGFHLLEITGHRAEQAMTFEEARPEIEARLADELRRAQIKALVAEMVSRARVEILAQDLR